jgi:hypothetical protein
MMIAGTVVSDAQSQSATSGKTAQSAKQKYPASAELAKFRDDPSNPELNRKKRALLENKSVLEKGIAENSISAEQRSTLEKRISILEKELSKYNSSDPKQNPSERDKLNAIYKSKQCNRAQFLSMSEQQQRNLFQSIPDLKITDLVNAKPETLSKRKNDVHYLTVQKFNSAPVNNKIQILNNPGKYVVAQNYEDLPQGDTETKEIYIAKERIQLRNQSK